MPTDGVACSSPRSGHIPPRPGADRRGPSPRGGVEQMQGRFARGRAEARWEEYRFSLRFQGSARMVRTGCRARSHMRRGGLRTWEHDSSPQQSSKTAEPYGKPTPAPARPSSPACNPLLRGFIQVLLRRRGAPCDLLPSSCSCWGCGASGRSCSPGPDRAWSRHHTTHRRHDPQAHAAFATEPGELVERSIPGIRRSTSAPVAGADVEP